MDVRPDEIAVRQLFDAMTARQPEAPPDRHSQIRRRARRHRLAQVAATLAAAAVIGAAAVGVVRSTAGQVAPTPERSLPSWALPWPDHRNGSVPQRVLDGAVTAWRHLAALRSGAPLSATAQGKVIWYVGQTAVSGQVVVVIFEVDSATGRRLVAGWATASDVMKGQPGWKPGSSPWVLYDVAAPRPADGLFIGLNVHGTTARPDSNPDSWIVLLAAPDVGSAAWSAPGPINSGSTNQGASRSGSGSVGLAPAVRGLVIAHIGQVSGRISVEQLDVGLHNTLPHPSYVGVPGSAGSQVPQLAAAAQVGASPGFRASSGLTAQGNSGMGLAGDSGRLAIRARCYGPGSLRLAYGVGQRTMALGRIGCDDVVHALTTRVRLRPGAADAVLLVYASSLTSYRVIIGTQG